MNSINNSNSFRLIISILLVVAFGTSLMISSCKKDKNSTSQSASTPTAVNNTTINVQSSQICNNGQIKHSTLPNCTIKFYYDKAQADTVFNSVFDIVTDSLGKSVIIGKKSGDYYYKSTGIITTGTCNGKTFNQTGTLFIRDGQPTTFHFIVSG